MRTSRRDGRKRRRGNSYHGKSMSWSNALMRLPIVGARKALEDAQRKLEQQRSEIVGLREDLQRARARADVEKKKRLALERRMSLRQAPREARPTAPPPG